MVVACIALAVALGGTSYAAITLPRNSVGTKQLRKNAVISTKIKNGSLLRVDFKSGQIPAGPRGLQGPPGTPGANGAPGAQGPPGPTLGVADTTGNVPPTVAQSFLVRTLNVTLPSSGSLLAIGRVRTSISCGPGSCAAAHGLYIDGNPIPASAARVPASANTTSVDNVAVFGIAQNLAAGPHAVTMRVGGEGNWSVFISSDAQLTTVMLGGN